MTAMTKAKCFASSLMPQFAECVGASIAGSALSALDSSRFVVFPGFCDVHVHFREPGFSIRRPSPRAAGLPPGAATRRSAPCPT